MAGIKSESVAGFIPESVADFLRNQHLARRFFCHFSLPEASLIALASASVRATRYACPLIWLPVCRLLPRAAGWSAATLCIGTFRTFADAQARVEFKG
jgi:hypothetical protein